MGRFYRSNRFDGKFGVALQNSDDPAIFGMREQEPSEIEYYLDGNEENIEQVAKKLDEQYDILEIPENERVYLLDCNEKDALQPVYELSEKYYTKHYREWNEELDRGRVPYVSKIWQKGAVETKDGIELAWCRVYLGTKIYTELVVDGYCSLTAEL